MTIATFTMLYNAVSTLDSGTSGLIYSLKSYYQDVVYQDNFINLMEIETVFKDGIKSIEKIETIEFVNVSFKYPRTDIYVLKNLNFGTVILHTQKLDLYRFHHPLQYC